MTTGTPTNATSAARRRPLKPAMSRREVSALRRRQIAEAYRGAVDTCRWAWTNRAPVGLGAAAVGTYAAGQAVYDSGVSTSTLAAGSVAGVLAAHALASRLLPAVKGWITSGSVAAGGLLTSATQIPPDSGVMLTALGGVSAFAAVAAKRTLHAPKASLSEPARFTALWAEHSSALGVAGSQVIAEQADELGVTLTVAVAAGKDGAVLIDEAKLRSIESAFDLRRGSVSGEVVYANTRHVSIRILTVDPHAQPVLWPGRRIDSITEAIPIGTYADGTQALLHLVDHRGARHMLIGGATGSGKSSLINQLLCELIACPDVYLIGADLKGGQELGPWKAVLPLVVDTPVATVDMLKAVNEVVIARTKTCQSRVWTPTPEHPAIVIVIDEIAELWETPGAITLFESIIRRVRSLGIHLIMATQYPTWAATGSRTIRSQATNRICFRMNEKGQSGLILQGLKGVVDAADLPDGGGYAYLETPEASRSMRARCYYLDDHTISQTISLATHIPVVGLDQPSAAALHNKQYYSYSQEHLVIKTDAAKHPHADQAHNHTGGALQPASDEPPRLPPLLHSVPLHIITGAEAHNTRDLDTAEKVAADREHTLRLITQAGPAGAQLKDLLRLTGRPGSTMHDWLSEFDHAGLIARIGRGRYATRGQEPAVAS